METAKATEGRGEPGAPFAAVLAFSITPHCPFVVAPPSLCLEHWQVWVVGWKWATADPVLRRADRQWTFPLLPGQLLLGKLRSRSCRPSTSGVSPNFLSFSEMVPSQEWLEKWPQTIHIKIFWCMTFCLWIVNDLISLSKCASWGMCLMEAYAIKDPST